MSSSVVDDGDALPKPPADTTARKLPLVARPAGTHYVRIHRTTDEAVWFGWNAATRQFRLPANRFDAPDRSHGVLYAAVTRDGSFAETIGRKPRTFRSNDELFALAVTTLTLTRELRLVDLTAAKRLAPSGQPELSASDHRRWHAVGQNPFTLTPNFRTASSIAAGTIPMRSLVANDNWLESCG